MSDWQNSPDVRAAIVRAWIIGGMIGFALGVVLEMHR